MPNALVVFFVITSESIPGIPDSQEPGIPDNFPFPGNFQQ